MREYRYITKEQAIDKLDSRIEFYKKAIKSYTDHNLRKLLNKDAENYDSYDVENIWTDVIYFKNLMGKMFAAISLKRAMIKSDSGFDCYNFFDKTRTAAVKFAEKKDSEDLYYTFTDFWKEFIDDSNYSIEYDSDDL